MYNAESAELELFRFFEMTPDLVCIADKEGFFKYINRAVCDKLGYTNDELFAQPIATFIHPEDKEVTSRRRAELLNGKALINFDNRYVSKSGKVIWLHWTSIYFPEKEIVFAIAKDVTGRKEKEKEIEEKYKEFKSLAGYFKTTLEKDRKSLAIELHEELAQLATVIKMDIDWLREHIPGMDKASESRIGHASAVLDLLINSVRRISYSISPNMLYDVGLNETLQWLCQEFTQASGIPCTFKTTYDDEGLVPDIQLDLFRICQETLNNVVIPVGASFVLITLASSENTICLSITIDGKSLETEVLSCTPGMENIRKRVALINGELSIKSDADTGKGICVTIAQQFSGNH